MAVVYIREQNTRIRKRGGRLLVEKSGELLAEILLEDTENVALFGNVQVTTQAISELLRRKIGLTFLSSTGRLKGKLSPETSGQVFLRLDQYRLTQDPRRALDWARGFVEAKLASARILLTDYRSNYPSDLLEEAEQRIRSLAGSVPAAATNNELLGLEGAAARAYFAAFPVMNRSELEFPGRRRRPATDPLNSLLSLGYTLVLNELSGLVEIHGLEPHLGFLHQPDYGRPSLPLDLLEPFRPAIVDRLTLGLLNERSLKADDFGRRAAGAKTGSVMLRPDAFRRYLGLYEKAMTTPRKSAPQGMRRRLEHEVQRLAKAIRNDVPFRPFPLEEEPCAT